METLIFLKNRSAQISNDVEFNDYELVEPRSSCLLIYYKIVAAQGEFFIVMAVPCTFFI